MKVNCMEQNEHRMPIYSDDGRLQTVGSDLKHIAFIMDGNGRWAKARGKGREYGHTEGAKAFERIVEYCNGIGVQAVTVYAFSTENWKRPPEEVARIMSLLEKYLDRVIARFSEYDVKLRFIGDRKVLSQRLVTKIDKAEQLTRNKSRILNIALNYGGRAEITAAINSLLSQGKKGYHRAGRLRRTVYLGLSRSRSYHPHGG